MLVPIVYLIIALARIQAGALAVEQGAREAGRAFVTAPVLKHRERREHGPRRRWPTATRASPRPARPSWSWVIANPCLGANARVTVRGEITVVLPGVPRFLSQLIPVQVTLTATHVATVDAYSVR